MNRDISQLISVLAQMQADIGSQRMGLAGLAKEIDRLAAQIRQVEPDRLAVTVTTAAAKAAADGVVRAADYAREARELAASIATLMAPEPRRRRRWKYVTLILTMLLCVFGGAIGGRFIGIARPQGCVAAGGAWAAEAGVVACLFH